MVPRAEQQTALAIRQPGSLGGIPQSVGVKSALNGRLSSRGAWREVLLGSRVIRAFVFPSLTFPHLPSPPSHLRPSRSNRKLVWFIIGWVKHDGWQFEVNLMKSGSGSYLKQITAFTNISSSVRARLAGRKLIKNKLKLIIASEKFQHIIDIDWISSASSQLTQLSQWEAESNTWKKFQEILQGRALAAPLLCSVDWSRAVDYFVK